jgi:hypothetical protein
MELVRKHAMLYDVACIVALPAVLLQGRQKLMLQG